MILGCVCKDLTNSLGGGNCIVGKYCYVTQPSTCNDLMDSRDIKGQKYSFEACKFLNGEFFCIIFYATFYTERQYLINCLALFYIN